MKIMKKITKIVIPAAGNATRFLPATKALPKEMFPIIDKPVIQIIVEEAVSAGVQEVIIVTGWNKRAIEDHFDYPYELLKKLEDAKKFKELKEVKRTAELANFIYIRQKGPLGNAVPILNARAIVGNEPFLVAWGDEFIVASPAKTQQLITAYEKYHCTILSGIITNNPEDGKKIAFASGVELADGAIDVHQIIEKPGVGKAPSNLGIVAGFLFTPTFFDAAQELIDHKETGAGGEYVYADVIAKMIKKGERVIALPIKHAKYYDAGSKIGFVKTIIDFGLKHPEIGKELNEYLHGLYG